MRFALVNDIHRGPPEAGFHDAVQRKLVAEADQLLDAFVTEMNERERPRFVVNLGDSIEDVHDREIDAANLRRVAAQLSKLEMPLYSLLGNHDVGSLGFREAASLLGADRTFFSFDIDGAHFVALGFEQPYSDADPADVRAVVPAEQLDWLAEDLALASTSVVVFSHYGLADDDMQGNFWFESEPQAAVIENRAEVRSLLERSGRVRAVISAHQHWNRLLVQNGIPYVTVTSLVENTRNDGVPAAARTLVTLREDRLVVEVRGNDPARFSLPT